MVADRKINIFLWGVDRTILSLSVNFNFSEFHATETCRKPFFLSGLYRQGNCFCRITIRQILFPCQVRAIGIFLSGYQRKLFFCRDTNGNYFSVGNMHFSVGIPPTGKSMFPVVMWGRCNNYIIQVDEKKYNYTPSIFEQEYRDISFGLYLLDLITDHSDPTWPMCLAGSSQDLRLAIKTGLGTALFCPKSNKNQTWPKNIQKIRFYPSEPTMCLDGLKAKKI